MTEQLLDYTGKVVLITGASGGIRLGCCGDAVT